MKTKKLGFKCLGKEFQDQVEKSVAFLKNRLGHIPEILMVLGTGLERMPSDFKTVEKIPYSAIPHFLPSTAPGHKSFLHFGRIGRKYAAVLQGRLHYYEGYSLQEITLPIRVMARLGSQIIIIGNAAGGLNKKFFPGSLMVINDHLNFIGTNPLRGPNFDSWGPRFPDMSEVYSERIIELTTVTAAKLKIKVEQGTYVAVPGPSLETPAETRYLQQCGADAVGMSTVPEVIVARHAGLEVLALSIIANVNDPDNFKVITVEDVITQVKRAEHNFLTLLNTLLLSL